jgi:hypothetical protein
VDKEMRRYRRYVSFIIFIFSTLLLTSCASAQCGDCDDKNPCTMDQCDGTICLHTPQSCADANSSALALPGKDAVTSTAQREGSEQNSQEPFVLKEAVNIPANCDDNNPCTRDSFGENGCVHDPVNCDDGSPCTTDYCTANGCVHDPVSCEDGNANTTDLCGPSGCVNTPILGKSSNTYSEEFLSPIMPETHNEAAKENTTINESQSVTEEAITEPKENPICDDKNPCTTDAYDGTSCVYAQLNCDDGNESTLDSCRDGACINEPIDSIDRSSIVSENNSTALSSDEALMARHPQSCDDNDPCTVDTFNGRKCVHTPKKCDDGNPDTFDYCFEGVCYYTTTNCDDKNLCTIDSYNGTECVWTKKSCNDGKPCTYDKCDPKKGCYYPSKCDDGNPCTVDYCNPAGGCSHSPVVCGPGKTCVDGSCVYLYYPYYPYYPYVAPTSALPSAQSYTIPAGTAITLPWARSVTALNTLKVENGIAYPGTSPLRFVRSLGLENQAVSGYQGYQTGLSISERAEMIGLSWKDASFTLTLIQPDGSALPVQGNNQNVMHLVGLNYDYYFLRSAAIGNWGIEVKPINPGANGVGFSLITGLVKGAVPPNQP